MAALAVWAGSIFVLRRGILYWQICIHTLVSGRRSINIHMSNITSITILQKSLLNEPIEIILTLSHLSVEAQKTVLKH